MLFRSIVSNKDVLRVYVKQTNPALDTESREAKVLMLRKIQAEVDSYRKGGAYKGEFPERWLPVAIAVLPEQFSESTP